MLDAQNSSHLWFLHTLFLDDINCDCQAFCEEWNCHPISGPNTNNKSLKDLHFLGQMQHGIYCKHEEHEEHGPSQEPLITSQQQEHINHEAVLVPSLQNPFWSNEEAVFFVGLHEVITQDITPDNFGLTLAEWGSEQYLPFETIHVGCCAAKDLDILLAEPIWYTWACLWCQALSTLSFYLSMHECS
ncbi:hypothetical protein V8B97DRAFT_1877167 [Scleroderma yunnanense]